MWSACMTDFLRCSTLGLLCLILSGCFSIPGKDHEVYHFERVHDVQATIIAVYDKQVEPGIDFIWSTNQQPDQREKQSKLLLSEIYGWPPGKKPRIGQQLLLKGQFKYQQTGAQTPILQTVVWSLNRGNENRPIYQQIRPPRCPNQ